jgi:hypothetical protein
MSTFPGIFFLFSDEGPASSISFLVISKQFIFLRDLPLFGYFGFKLPSALHSYPSVASKKGFYWRQKDILKPVKPVAMRVLLNILFVSNL